jgi:D-xylose transport system ATP-binding protein
MLLQTPIMHIRDLSVRFGGVLALDQVNFDIRPHEVVAVVGENAAGKSTLAKVMAGVLQPTAGSILIDDQPVTIPSPSAAHRLGVVMVFQELALVDELDVTANLFLGREMKTRVFLSDREMEQLARQKLNQIGARVPSVKQKVGSLSGGQRQSVAIARAMLGDPRVVILDEPTASLSLTQTAEVLDLISHLRSAGCGVMLISHNLADVQAVADRVVVLRHGRNNGEAAMSEINYEDIVAAITGAVDRLPVPRLELKHRIAM